jgi:hypothetical protein
LAGVLLLVLGAARLSVHRAKATEPKMDYWFIETLMPAAVRLPAGVEIRASNPSSQLRADFVIENKTQTPLYVMSLGYKDVLVMTTPDPNWKARVNGAHEAASFIAVPGRQANLDMPALTDLDKNLVDRNVLSGDPPLENTPVPAAQSSELLLVYGEQVIEVPFMLTYSPNTHFGNGLPASTTLSVQAAETATPTQLVESAAERATREYFLAVGLIGVTILAVSTWLVWLRLSRGR